MVMTYDGALVMPSSYAVMEQEEMTYARDVYKSAANGAYIADGGDTAGRQKFYDAVWAVL